MTDYSSIAVDFMENGVPTVLFRFDFEKYTSFRKIRPLANMSDVETVYTLEELKISIKSKINSVSKINNLRDIENEKSMWINLIEDLIKSS
jgi:CDP-glycerol glycerophosphotransferase (TagB/SpsB family)